MFGVLRAAIRAFAIGVVVGVLFAPRPGVETRKMLSERLAATLDQLLEIAALPPIQPERTRANGHAEPRAPKRTRAAGADARSS